MQSSVMFLMRGGGSVLELATGGSWNITNRHASLRVKFLSWSFNIHYVACQVNSAVMLCSGTCSIVRLKCDGTCAETRFRLSPKWTSPFKSVVASVQSTAGSRGVRISLSNAG